MNPARTGLRAFAFVATWVAWTAVPAGAQYGTTPTTEVSVVATPMGAWNSDGFVDAGNETATWDVNATVTFSTTAVCPDPIPIAFALADVTANATGGVDPASRTVTAPPAGGATYASTNASLTLKPEAPGGGAESARLHVTVGPCPTPAGTAPRAETNLTLSVRPLFRPGLNVTWDATHAPTGVFNFTLRNTGNGPLLVEATVNPVADSPLQPVTAPSPARMAAGGVDSGPLTFPNAVPGTYDIRFVGRFDGADGASLPKVELTQRVEITVARVVEEKNNAAGPEPALVALAVAAAILGRRRAP